MKTPGLILLAIIMMVFHFGNAPMGRLIAQEFSIQLGTPFRTTALITGVAQLAMIGVAVAAPYMIRRFGLAPVILIGLIALPIRGLIAGSFQQFWSIYPVQILDGVGAGLLGIATPVAVERLLSGSGRFNVGLAALMTIQGIGASTSNAVAGTLVSQGRLQPRLSRAWRRRHRRHRPLPLLAPPHRAAGHGPGIGQAYRLTDPVRAGNAGGRSPRPRFPFVPIPSFLLPGLSPYSAHGQKTEILRP